MPALSPIESEFASTEEAEAYDVWFRAKVREALDDPRPGIPHEQVMAEMQAIIDGKAKPEAWCCRSSGAVARVMTLGSRSPSSGSEARPVR